MPADGFYEWVGSKNSRQPLFITLPDKDPFAFAGLWETWQDKAVYRSCTIITRASEGVLKEIHHRMPLVLAPEAYAAWLETGSPQEILENRYISEFVYFQVSRNVNWVVNNEPVVT